MEALARRSAGDPRILAVTYWYQLPKHLQRQYAGGSRLGRIYTLVFAGEVVYLWAEAGLYEEAAWHHSRLLDLDRDGEVIAHCRRVDGHGQAV